MARLKEKLKMPEQEPMEDMDVMPLDLGSEDEKMLDEEMPEEEVGVDLASVSDEELLDEVKARGLQI